MPFVFEQTEIPDLILIKPKVFSDTRGYFTETFKHSDFVSAGIDQQFLQDSETCTLKRTLRGMHYQTEPKAQGKLVRAVAGSMFDVVVDIRKDSPTFSKWFGTVLSDENKWMLWIPVGFAHGYMALENDVVTLYKFTNEYSPEQERGIIWNDSQIAIDWPLQDPIISERDKAWPELREVDDLF